MKKYKDLHTEPNLINEPDFTYLITHTQQGMPFQTFEKQANKYPLTQMEWSDLLHLSERTIQRYKKENKSFEPLYTEKILEVILLFNKGIQVLGSEDAFYDWLHTPCIALGQITPFSIIDNSFGIDMVKTELSRMEEGVYS